MVWLTGMSDIPGLEGEDDFDFVRECIETYRLAENDVESRIKALTLLQKVLPPRLTVKEPEANTTNRSAVKKAQDALRGSKT